MTFPIRTVLAITGLLCVGGCGSTLSESGVKPLAGGSYQATLQNGVLLSFAVAETRDGKLAGSGQLGSATAGVSFSVTGTVRRDSVHLRMLKENGPRPQGRWAELGLLEPVRDYPHRHASTLLVFDAVERALDTAEAAKPASATARGS